MPYGFSGENRSVVGKVDRQRETEIDSIFLERGWKNLPKEL